MVSDRVSVESISAATATGSSTDSGNPWHRWESDGTGQFTISSQNDSTTQGLEGLSRGSKITMHLKDECKEFRFVLFVRSLYILHVLCLCSSLILNM